MDSSSENNKNLLADCDTSWTPSTNWTIAGGSLLNSVTFESSLSLLNDGGGDGDDDDDDDDDDVNNDPDQSSSAAANSSLILVPPWPDCPPCEITINFAEKHELRQVYVRSTARVYEMYYAPELGSDNEYLCTVRCGIAARDDAVLRTTDVEERLRSGSSLSANDDDWVEVRVAERNSSSPSDSDTKQGKILQDLFEATAEITDVNPCKSLTLRLLSLQNKGCACVDEVYVFADPIDAATTDKLVDPVENNSGNPLMAMLMPTLLQLSKNKDVNRSQNKYNIDTGEQLSQGIGSKVTDPIHAANEIQKGRISDADDQLEVELQEADTTLKPMSGVAEQLSGSGAQPDKSSSHIDEVLDVLVSRVNRMEDLLLKFEERMLKPISSIDDRLQRVEQKLEVLTKKTQNPEFISCTRISAPEFSCSDSETNSFYNSGSMHLSQMACEENSKDSPSVTLPIPPSASPAVLNDARAHPSLVVTAPDFSICDDGNEEHAVEPAKESLTNKSKHAMSIDDALASALAGFLSSTSVEPIKCTRMVSIKAPEFPNEEELVNDNLASAGVHHEMTIEPSTSSTEPDGTEQVRNSLSPSSESDKIETATHNDDTSMRMYGEVDKQWKHSVEEEADPQKKPIDQSVMLTLDGMESNSRQIIESMGNEEVDNKLSDTSVLQITDNLEVCSGNQSEDEGSETAQEGAAGTGSESTQGGAAGNGVSTSLGLIESDSDNGILQKHVNVLPEDLETSVLEVKFTSQENLKCQSPLEALLAGMRDLDVQVFCSDTSGSDGSHVDDESNLIPADGWGVTSSATNGHISVDMDYCNVMPLNMEADKLQDRYSSTSQEPPAGSLI